MSAPDFFLAQYDTGKRTSVYAAPLSDSLRAALAQDGATLVPVWKESALAAERGAQGRVVITGEHLWKAFGNALGLTSWAHSPAAWRKPYEDAAEHLNRMLTPTPEAIRGE